VTTIAGCLSAKFCATSALAIHTKFAQFRSIVANFSNRAAEFCRHCFSQKKWVQNSTTFACRDIGQTPSNLAFPANAIAQNSPNYVKATAQTAVCKLLTLAAAACCGDRQENH
jgi:hypothetical protein